jgi:hypothetical protein
MKTDPTLTSTQLMPDLEKFWTLATDKVHLLESAYDPANGSPVYTVDGKYRSRGWTEWTQGFQFGIPLLVFSATGDREMLELGKKQTLEKMAPHLTHFGVHDHGFNNLSTYGHLLRCTATGLADASAEEQELYRLALRISGAVQARRWTPIPDGGFIYSFNGPHSLFIDTIRTCRILMVSHLLGHRMLEENDLEVNLLERALVHGLTTARYAVFQGNGRDLYDIRGRVAHESVFNTIDGNYRCPNSQQGYSGFTTWTRGLAWAMLGFGESLEFLEMVQPKHPDAAHAGEVFLDAARATCDFYLEHSAADGIPYWDTGAPELHRLGDYQHSPADPYNGYEPVDSSAAAIGAQGLIRLGKVMDVREPGAGEHYLKAGLTILKTLLGDPYLSTGRNHQGILLHSVYHRPNGWDHIPEGFNVPCGESSMWGDYHMAELCYTVHRLARNEHYTFFEGLTSHPINSKTTHP